MIDLNIPCHSPEWMKLNSPVAIRWVGVIAAFALDSEHFE
jgi:hypothetical protein